MARSAKRNRQQRRTDLPKRRLEITLPEHYYFTANSRYSGSLLFLKTDETHIHLPVAPFEHPGARAQYTAGNAHSHNDYQQAIPFEKAFSLHFGSIEADVFLQNGELYVAHTPGEIDTSKTLRRVYLQPLREKALAKIGAFGETKQQLQILIDFKTEAAPTMAALMRQLKEFPELMNHPKLTFAISGNRPPAEQWPTFPACIQFDGRPGVAYPAASLKKVALISDNFRNYTKWNGKGIPVAEDLTRIEQVIAQAHALGKKFRFWATPDDVNTWKTMMKLGVDYINTDKTDELATYLRTRVQSQYQADSAHAVYQPKYRNNDRQSKVKNVILLIGDGMGLTQIYSGYTANYGKLNLFGMLNIGFSKTSSSDSYITDSAAGGTAMASGKKTKNRYVGVDHTGAPMPSIADLVAPLGMKSAIISSGDVTDATPAAFYGHTTERDRHKEIALGLLESPVSILIGAGQTHFEGMWETLRNKGYAIGYHLSALDTIRSNKYIVLADSAQLSMAQGRGPSSPNPCKPLSVHSAGNPKGSLSWKNPRRSTGAAIAIPYPTLQPRCSTSTGQSAKPCGLPTAMAKRL